MTTPEQNKPQELKSENFSEEGLEIVVKHFPDCIVEFDVTAEPKFMDEAKEVAFKKVSKQVTIPGFRKG